MSTTPLTPAEQSLRARLAAYSLHSQRDSAEVTAPARAAFIDRFKIQVDPDLVLSETERNRRAEAALKAHMTRLALKSTRARRRAS